MSVPIELLRRTDQILATEANWIKGTSRRDARGKVPILDKDAVCWCLSGALCRAIDQIGRTKEDVDQVAWLLSSAVRQVIGHSGHYVIYNDLPSTTFDDIKNLIKIAIQIGELGHDVPDTGQPEVREPSAHGVSGANSGV